MRWLCTTLALLVSAWAASVGWTAELGAADLPRLLALIAPAAGEERWREIPWRTGLLAAREEARGLDRPLLLWEMDGHPLGCT
jgi:hypothetical protein